MNCRGFFPERTRRKLQNLGSNSITKGVSSRFILTLFVKKPTLSNYQFNQLLKYIESRLIRYFQKGGILQLFRGIFRSEYIGGVFFSQKPSPHQKQELILCYGSDRIAPGDQAPVDPIFEALAIQPLCRQYMRPYKVLGSRQATKTDLRGFDYQERRLR